MKKRYENYAPGTRMSIRMNPRIFRALSRYASTRKRTKTSVIEDAIAAHLGIAPPKEADHVVDTVAQDVFE